MNDMLDINTVQFHSSAEEVKAWPVTVALTGIVLKSDAVHESGVAPIFDRTKWPEFVPPGWNGPLQATLWLFVQVNSRWHGAAFMEFWKDRVWTGAPLLTFFSEWVYNNQWGPELQSYVPQVGHTIAFMVTAGQLRLNKNVFSVKERTNIVTCRLVGDAQYTFDGSEPSSPVPKQPAVGTDDVQLKLLNQIADSLTALTAAVERLDAKVSLLQKPQRGPNRRPS